MINNIDTPDDITIALLEAVAERGGVPFIKLQTSKIMRARNMLASEKSIKDISELSLNEMKQMDAFVAIRGGNNAFYSSDVISIKLIHVKICVTTTVTRMQSSSVTQKTPSFYHHILYLPLPPSPGNHGSVLCQYSLFF
jgi:hypothetical protein